MNEASAHQETINWFSKMRHIYDGKNEVRILKHLIRVELKKIITGEAAVPSKQLLLAMRKAKMKPIDMAKMFHSQFWNETGKKMLSIAEINDHVSYWENTFSEANRAVDKNEKLIYLKKEELQIVITD